ncbi:MAG: hypothetical protein HZC37_01940 [Burkholderiales bacterium]|nr:hypothetical protein [Burkholderiales bacterium]
MTRRALPGALPGALVDPSRAEPIASACPAHRRRALAGLARLALPLAGWTLMPGLASAAATGSPAQWARWADHAYEGARDAVRHWQTQAVLRGVVINGPAASGGRITGPSLKPLIRGALRDRGGAPDEVAERFAGAVAEAWALWHEAVRVPGLPWYPAFASFPGAQAVPTPNVPTPLAALVSAQAAALSPDALKARIVQHLGAHAQQPGAAAAAEQFAQRFGARFAAWAATVMVRNVIGSGPVPSFKPPAVPAGPVVAGKIAEVPGSFALPPF